ncbi:heavy metal transporter [Streptomyces pinistramenti]|uniref:heavy metal transporter n=1 Tax=Streptomyces pinistramenti TaxID=2884812 RepID=UPI001D074578|nr:heavy metal transporter [Streptomyces pinistramenti]MCB5911882.1 heavy metal transporter [Streptomyces pinistramenti]
MSAQSSAPPRRRRLWRITAAFAVLLGLAVYLVVQYVTGGPGAPRCTVQADGGAQPYELTPEQAANAATIAAVGSARELPERAVTIALATAMQESQLRNIDFGDRDSVGLFQQRPSQDWGTVKQIMDPVYSAGEFYTHLVKVRGYTELPLTEAAQRVQRSAFPRAYAQHEGNATQLAGALTGRAGAAMSCTQSRPVDGRSGGGTRVREKLVREFGNGVLPHGKAAGGDERTVRVPATAKDSGKGEGSRHGWEVAMWAMAHSAELHIEQISYAGQTWRAADSGKGWVRQEASGDAAPGQSSDDVRIIAGQ